MNHSFKKPLKVGAVSYLNSKPLIHGLSKLLEPGELVLDFPSKLADRLEAGELHAALIPSVEVLRHPQYEIVSDACVATHGPVLSVKLYSRVSATEIQSLALDQGSRTSAALARILLAERFGLHPRLEPLEMTQSIEDTHADAVLLIGDRAMHVSGEGFEFVWDLGQEWIDWTGLPFVFAMWAAPAGAVSVELEQALTQARDSGVERLLEIARREAPILNIEPQIAIDYLTKNLYYRLGADEQNGLKLFHELAAKHGLVPEEHNLVFRNCTYSR